MCPRVRHAVRWLFCKRGQLLLLACMHLCPLNTVIWLVWYILSLLPCIHINTLSNPIFALLVIGPIFIFRGDLEQLLLVEFMATFEKREADLCALPPLINLDTFFIHFLCAFKILMLPYHSPHDSVVHTTNALARVPIGACWWCITWL